MTFYKQIWIFPIVITNVQVVEKVKVTGATDSVIRLTEKYKNLDQLKTLIARINNYRRAPFGGVVWNIDDAIAMLFKDNE